MKIAGDYQFDASRQSVWEALLDPEVLASVMPGCEKLEKTGEDAYEGVLNIKIGPVQGRFQGKIRLEEIDPPNGYTIQIDGRGAPGFVKATGRLALAEEGGGTKLTYDSDAQVGGRVASVGQRLLDSSAKAIIKQSLEGLNGALVARAGVAQGEEPLPVEAPSQSELAARVAKDVAKDLIPPKARIALLILGLLLILWLLYSLLT